MIGHSRLGKTALWAGAQDERFALVVSNDSGEGGAALARRRFGETTESITGAFPHWFCSRYREYAGREDGAARGPARAAGARRAAAALRRERDRGPLGRPARGVPGREGGRARVPPPRARGASASSEMPVPDRPVGDSIGYHLRRGTHALTAYDWEQYLDFADRHLLTRRRRAEMAGTRPRRLREAPAAGRGEDAPRRRDRPGGRGRSLSRARRARARGDDARRGGLRAARLLRPAGVAPGDARLASRACGSWRSPAATSAPAWPTPSPGPSRAGAAPRGDRRHGRSRRLAGRRPREALSALDAADVVIGPAEDGGYYLVALRAPRPGLFAGIEWSTPSVREETLARAAAARRSPCASLRACATWTRSTTCGRVAGLWPADCRAATPRAGLG